MPGGTGDTDIWKISVGPSSYGTPVNLGTTVNTAGKEGFPFITDDNMLYFCSSGKQGFGGLDIYRIDLNKPSSEAINIGKPVNSAEDDFSFSFNTVKNIGFFASNVKGSDDIYIAIPVCKVEAIAHVKDKKTGKALSDAAVTLLNSSNNSLETKRTDAKGDISFEVNCDAAYSFQATEPDYDPARAAIAKTKSGKVDVNVDLDPVEVVITDKEVILKNVYFEFNKSNITDQGSVELDKLVKVMNDNPAMVIYVKSHTDSNGTAAYNMKLSEQRAQATAQYVISKGIKSDRISGKGFGFTEPKVNCTKCTDAEDAQNRRSEFIIVKK
jgi:outer membrane protein OmpA-like peptidoglycan-associated protein